MCQRPDPIHLLERQVVSPRTRGGARTKTDPSRCCSGMNANWLQSSTFRSARQQHRAGRPDQGQPTHFYPRRNPFLSRSRAEGSRRQRADLSAHDERKTEHAYASLRNDYMIDIRLISTEVGGDGGSLRDELRTNIPGAQVEGTRAGASRSESHYVGVCERSRQHTGERGRKRCDERLTDTTAAQQARRASQSSVPTASSIVPSSGPGLRLSWIVLPREGCNGDFSPTR